MNLEPQIIFPEIFKSDLQIVGFHNPFRVINQPGNKEITQSFGLCMRCSQLYRLSTQRLNIDMKPKEVLLEAVNKFLKEKLKEKGFVFSDSQLKFTKKLKDGPIGEIGFRPMSYS